MPYAHKVPAKYMKKSCATKKKKTSSRVGHNRSTTQINRGNLRDHTIVADRYLTSVATSFSGTIATPFAAGQFLVSGNAFYQPWSTPSHNIGTIVTGSNSSNTGALPMGYTALTTLYNQYRVNASSIKITVQPTTTIDCPIVVVFPTVGLFAAATGGIDLTQNQRYSRWKQCSTANNVKENSITNYMSSAKVLGLTKQQYEDQLAIQIAQQPGTNLDWYWQIAIYQPDGTTADFTSKIFVTVELNLYMEFSDPIGVVS